MSNVDCLITTNCLITTDCLITRQFGSPGHGELTGKVVQAGL